VARECVKMPNEERKRFWESTRPEKVEVKRNMGGKLWTFEVRDSVANFTNGTLMISC